MDVVQIVLIFAPILLILWLANLSHRKRIEGDVRSERTLKMVSYGLLFLYYALFMLAGLALLSVSALNVLSPEVLDAPAPTLPGFPPDRLVLMGGSLLVFALLGLFLLTRPARRLFARLTPIDPTNPVHAVALSLSAMVLMQLAFTAAVGLENLADMVEATTQQTGAAAVSASGQWALDITLLIMGLIGVGFLARRGFGTALTRLGIVRPTVAQVIIGIATGIVMVPVVVVAEGLASRVGLGATTGVERLTELLVGPLTQSIFGILTLGLAAALGEETVFRGALLPRFGLVLTTLLFALVHSNYGISFSTVAVFAVGLVLGVIRLRANTTTAMITHAVYNMSLGLITFLGLMQNT